MKKRVLALLMGLALLVGLFPAALAADTAFTVTGGTVGTDYTITENVLHIKSGKAMTVSGGTVDAPMTGSILVESGVTADLKLDALYLTAPEYSPAVRVEKTATLNLSMGQDQADGTPAAVLTGGKGRAGIEVPKTATLVVKEGNGGTLKAVAAKETTSSVYPAAIGESGATVGSINVSGWKYADGVGTIKIEGGKVYAVTGTDNGTYSGAAIGSATFSKNVGDIIISGGDVKVKGNPAIGTNLCTASQFYNDRATGSITITGGTVTNEKWKSTGGIEAPGCPITISGGTVNIDVYNTNVGIGHNGSTVTIKDNADVTVKLESNGINIGGQEDAAVNIEGGKVTVIGDGNIIGIGGGTANSRCKVNISGGVVNSAASPAIGGNYCDVTISGGTVTAAGKNAPAIGGDYRTNKYDYHGTVTITGGTVTANGGKSLLNVSPGIGPYSKNPFGADAKITINGGVVSAGGAWYDSKAPSANGIGVGYHYSSDGSTWGTGSGWFATTSADGKRGNALIIVNTDQNPAAANGGANGIGDSAFSLDEVNGKWDGAFIVGNSGKVLGHPCLQENATLPAATGLTIPHGTSWGIAVGKTLTTGKYEEDRAVGTGITNSGTFDCLGTLTTNQGGSFVNAADGVFNWYGTVNGTMDTSAQGNIVNYPSTLALAADKPAATYGDQVTFTATVSREPKGDATAAITADGGVVDFYLDGAKTPFASENATLSGNDLTASTSVYAVGESWKAGSKHTVTAKYRDGEGVTGTPKAQQLPAETAQGVEVTVGKKALDDSMVGNIADVTFNGKAQEPAVTVTHTVNGKNAITNKDYTVTYADNVNAGTAKVTVKAADSGNYSGSVEKNFTILKATSDPAAVEVTKNLYYAQNNQVQIDLGAKLPENRGTTTYTVAGAGAPVSGTPTVSDSGVLSFATAAGQVDDTNTFTVKAEMQNYTDVTFTVKVTLKDKTLLTVSGVSVAGTKDGKRVYDGAPAAYTGTPVTNEASYADGFAYTWYAVSSNGDTLLSAAPSKVGSYKLVVAVSDESELYRGQQVIPFTIEKAPITVTAGSYKVSKIYDGTTAAGTAKGELALEGVYGEDKVTVSAVPGAYAAKNAGDDLTVDAALTLGGADSGNYVLKNATVSVPASIAKAPLTVTAATVADKTYDGKTDGTVTGVTITGAVNGETLILGADYKAVAAFTDANAGADKTAAVTLELLNGNYTMSKTAFTATASIRKAAPPAAKALSVDVANQFAKEYTVKLAGGLGAPEDGCEYGEVRYTASLTYEMSPDTVVVTVKGGTLTLAVENIDSEAEYEKAFIVAVQAESTNYTNVSFDVNVNTVNRIVPIGAPTVDGSLSYGQKLSELALAGTMKDGTDETKTVEGTFAWAEPDSVPAVADKKAMWVFTPKDTETYLEISGEAGITVEKAVPVGTPTVSAVTESGKTLADAALSGGFTNPNNGTAVAGALTWKDAPTTEVKANTDYEWLFTPGDGENYETVTGELTLWRVSSDNVPTGSTSSSTVKNEDGSTTKTVTNRRTGTVTETTTMANGDKLVVETKKDGTVTETFTGKDGSKRETVTNPDGSMTSAITTAEGVKAKSEKTAGGQVTASVTLPKMEKDATVTLPVLPAAPGKAEIKLTTDVAVKVVAPVTGGSNSTVAVLVKDDGTEEVIKASVLTEDGLLIPVSGDATIKVVDNSKTFNDVPNNSWYTESVDFVSAREMLNGTGENTFTPDAPTTRAMLMTILARYDGVDTSGGTSWYEKGMAWAREKGVSDGTNPDGSITREQLATMLWRYAGEPKTTGGLTAFQDASAVSAYAQEALKWAVEQGIVTGKGGAVLDPLGNATRAEVAAMLARFCKAMAK